MTQRVLRLLHLTDTHLHASPDARMRGVNTHDTLLAVIEQAMAHDDQPEAILATGDLVQDETRAGYERLREILGGFDLPVYCLPGNHDAPGIMAETLGTQPFQVGGEFTAGPWTVALLSSFHQGDDGGRVSDTELERLSHVLADSTPEYFMVCLHHQPVPMGSAWLDGVGLRNADAFMEIITGCPRARALVWGHVHQASDRRRGELRLLSTPSTCMQFLPNSDRFAVDTQPPGYRWIDLHANGNLDTQVAWLEQ